MRDVCFVRRVTLRNYKSIAGCCVELAPLTFLVGPNAAGKSNFLDALRFVSDSLRSSLDHALRDRGGINEVRRRSGGHPTHFGVRLELAMPDGSAAEYEFEIGARRDGGYEVERESCRVAKPLGAESHFRVERGEVVRSTAQTPPPAAPDRLYLVNAAGLAAFRPVYDLLSRMGFYNLNPDRIRELQSPDAGEILARDGSNLSSVYARLCKRDSSVKERIEDYLRRVVPDITGVDYKSMGPMETVEFRQRVKGAKHPWRFYAANMSDGTLRAFGVLVALFQPSTEVEASVPLIGLEEPEIALHPAAAGALLDGFKEASRQIQVLVTSHSPDLLDDDSIDSASILAVTAQEGNTIIGALDEGSRSALRERLYSVAELLRLGQLAPDPSSVSSSEAVQLELTFGS